MILLLVVTAVVFACAAVALLAVMNDLANHR